LLFQSLGFEATNTDSRRACVLGALARIVPENKTISKIWLTLLIADFYRVKLSLRFYDLTKNLFQLFD
jgi:hypothetical protein